MALRWHHITLFLESLLEGQFELIVLNKYGGQFANTETINFEEIVSLSSASLVSGDILDMTGGEIVELTGSFPNCDSEVDVKVKRMDEDNWTYVSTTGNNADPSTYHKVINTRGVLQENRFTFQLVFSSHDGLGNTVPQVMLCKENSEAETEGYSNCHSGVEIQILDTVACY